MEEASKVIGFAPDALWITLGVLVAVIIIAKATTDLMINAKKLKAPEQVEEKSMQEKLNSDHERLSKLESATERQEKEMQLLLRSQVAMLHHMIDGNGVDGLKAMQKQIEDFMIYGEITRGGSEQ